MAQKNKILYIGNKLAKHGFSLSSIETLGPLLEKEGYLLLYRSDKKNIAARLLSMLMAILKYRKSIAVVLIDTYSSNAFYYAWASAWLCRLLAIKYVPILRGGNLPERIANNPKMSDHVFLHSVTNVVVSDYLKKVVEEKKYRYTLIFNNIDLALYDFQHREHVVPKLLWVRAFHSVYNPWLAIKIVKELSEKYGNVTLTMVGPQKDESLKTCKELCDQMGLTDMVTFTGKLSKEDWRALSKKHDIFINTTNFDNLPISVLEALALGMPVVSTNVGGVPYLIENEINGLLVDPDNVEQMTNAIDRLVNNAVFTSHISRGARNTAELYDWKKIRNDWNNLLRPLINPLSEK